MTRQPRRDEVCADRVAAVSGGADDFIGSEVIGHLPQVGCVLFKVGGPCQRVGIDPG